MASLIVNSETPEILLNFMETDAGIRLALSTLKQGKRFGLAIELHEEDTQNDSCAAIGEAVLRILRANSKELPASSKYAERLLKDGPAKTIVATEWSEAERISMGPEQ
jgi:hypothetical protein